MPYVPVESYQLDTGIPSFGIIIQVSDGASPETFHTVAGTGDIDGPSTSVNVNDATTHATGIPYRSKRPGLIDPGQISFPVRFDPQNPSHSAASVFGLQYMYANRAVRKWRIIGTDPSMTTRQFKGFINDMGESHPIEGLDERKVTITIDGPITVVATPA